MRIRGNEGAALWMAKLQAWCADYEVFLKERNDRGGCAHERLRKARRAIAGPCNAGTLFTYLEEEVVAEGVVPSTSNKIENLNGRIRWMLSTHRGMNVDRRIKAVFWFCYMESNSAASPPLFVSSSSRDCLDPHQEHCFRSAKAKIRYSC